MKKFFGRNRQYEEDMEWEEFDAVPEEDSEYYEENDYSEEEYFEEETEAAVFFEGEGEEAFFEEEPYYETEEVYEDGVEFSEEEASLETDAEVSGEEVFSEADGGVYEEEIYEEEVYEEDGIEGLPEDDAVYFEEDVNYEEEEEEEEILAWSAMPDKNIFQKIWYSMVHMSAMDRVITTTGVLVLILAVAAGGIFASAQMLDKEVASFDMVGTQLDGITLIGEHGLTAVTDAQLAKEQTANAIENEEKDEENGEYNENDYKREVEVTLNMTSIEKDLKLKFVNSSTNKLIANVPFSVTVKTPDGKSETWTDDDMDGIIYKSDITPGNYSVAMNALTDSKYAGYIISTSAKKVTVRKEIAYEKVDVSDEIKNESELAQKEDAENELEVESELVDTVAWVESTVTPGKVVWTEVSRANLNVDTSLFAQGGPIMKTAAEGSVGVLLGQTEQLAANTSVPLTVDTNTADGGISTITASETSPGPSSDPETETTPNPETSPSTSPENPTPSPSVSPENPSPSPSPEEPDQGTVTELTLNKTSLSLIVGGWETLTVTVKPETEKDKVTWTSDKPSVATVENGKVTAVAAGTAEITVKAGDMTAKCTVTVTDANVNITIDPASISILSGESKELTVTITDGSASGQVTVKSNSENIATATAGTPATADGKTTVKVTVKGAGAGTATITVTYKVGNVEKSATATVKVLSKDNKLVDKNNNQIWVKVSEDKYIEATYADYYNYNVFYLRSETAPRYTGWQSIGGKMYYFDANGNKVTGEQVIQGAKYNFASDGSLVVGSGSFGIDVSKWNGKIDWNAVKNSGVSYVIIRCGYRGYGSGALVVDPYFEQNIKGATAAGIKVGIYFFTQAVNKNEAVEEASMVLQLVKGYTISYPIFLDVEYSGAAGNTGRADKLDVATRTEIIKAFCETIRNSGYTAGVYANKSWLTGMIDTSQLSKYKIWLAQYAAAPTYAGRYDMWQYKSNGRITGINGDVDLNISYLGY